MQPFPQLPASREPHRVCPTGRCPTGCCGVLPHQRLLLTRAPSSRGLALSQTSQQESPMFQKEIEAVRDTARVNAEDGAEGYEGFVVSGWEVGS